MFPRKTNMASDGLVTVYVTGMLSDVAYHMAELCAQVRIYNEHKYVINYTMHVRLLKYTEVCGARTTRLRF